MIMGTTHRMFLVKALYRHLPRTAWQINSNIDLIRKLASEVRAVMPNTPGKCDLDAFMLYRVGRRLRATLRLLVEDAKMKAQE